jgi:hypothetical protein
MTGPGDGLRRILGPAGPDSGCDRSGDLIDQLVEARLSGRPIGADLAEVATHLEACPDCREDYLGLRAIAEATAGGPGEGPASASRG